ncbi:MAG: succinate dehydrogenase/fumarate reductase iron-sulfur subunit [Epsilonproteobacteria bacterium]|nr:succinate dehydrogenase [Campylobacterota bacterium]NPA56972.1 succinate dehydrogenase/fumarate reductase iron-sulfur subunit [Campylobacterota bacterium]
MVIEIRRYHRDQDSPSTFVQYKVDPEKTLLDNLITLKEEVDPTLTFSRGCRSGVCGSCALRVNGEERLACMTRVQEGDRVEPLSVLTVIRDLVVERESSLETLDRGGAFLMDPQEIPLSEEDERLIERQSDCILCESCFSSCPVYETNPHFLGPFTLTRVYRYLVDKREGEKRGHIDRIVENGIWDCTLCGRCGEVCPMGIDPKNDILLLQSWASRYGYSNPQMASFGSYGLEF